MADGGLGSTCRMAESPSQALGLLRTFISCLRGKCPEGQAVSTQPRETDQNHPRVKQRLPRWPQGSSWRRTKAGKETYLLSRRCSSLAWLLTSLQIQLGSQPVVKAHVGGSGGGLGHQGVSPRKSPLDTEQYKELPQRQNWR